MLSSSVHWAHIWKVFEHHRATGLTVKIKKCHLGMSLCHYLEHVVGSWLLQPQPAKIEAIVQFAMPQTKKEVWMFLGLTGYYQKFIENYSLIAATLSDLTKKSAPRKIVWTTLISGTEEMPLWISCSSKLRLHQDIHFINRCFGPRCWSCPQDEEGHDHPIAFFSRKLVPWEEKYLTIVFSH